MRRVLNNNSFQPEKNEKQVPVGHEEPTQMADNQKPGNPGKGTERQTDYAQNPMQAHPTYDYYGEPDEIDIREYIDILWKWKWIILAVTAIAVATAGVLSFFVLKPVYEASTQIMVPKTVLPNDVITSPYFLRTVLTQLNLDQKYDPFTLAKAISVQTSSGSDLTTIKVQDEDPTTAKNIINAVADCFIQFVKNHNAEVNASLVKDLETKKAESEKTLAELKKQRDDLILQSNLSGEKLELSRLESLITSQKTAMTDAESQIKQLQKGIEELQKNLDSIPKTVPGPLDYAGRPTEVPNETYQQLEQSLALKKVSLAEVQVQLDEIRASLPSLESEYQAKQKTVAQIESQLSDIEEEISRVNTEIAAFDAEIAKTSTSLPEASVVAPAITPQLPVKPRKLLNMAVAGVLGGFVSVFGVFFIEYWRSPRKYQNVGPSI